MARVTQKSFNGGVLSPSLYSRNDLAKYSIGLKSLVNGFVRIEGCVSNRAGLEFVCEVKNSNEKTRLIPFAFNTEQTYVIELGNNYARFIKDGGQIVHPSGEHQNEPVEIATSYLADDLSMLKYAQNADVLTICHSSYPPCELTRSSHYDWSLNAISVEPSISSVQNVTAQFSGSTSSNTKTYSYIVTAIASDSYEESNRSEPATVVAHLEGYWLTNEYVTVSWSAVSNACEYNIYRDVNGIFAYVGTSSNTSFVDRNIEPDLSLTAPIAKNPFAQSNYPSCVNYFQQRKIFACLKNDTQSLVTSQVGTDDNFNISRPLNSSDSIQISLSEREVNEIRHLVGLNDLVVLTSGGEWKVNGADGSFSANPTPIARLQSFYGSSHIMPVVSGNMILYVQGGNSTVRDLGYEYLSDSYNGDELSIFVNHLFDNNKIVDMAYSKEPYSILYCVMEDGTINALTYDKKQEVAGWHKHVTDGEFESVAIIRENYEDVPYFVVKRTINGTTKRYIERLHSRNIDKTTDGFFVDCGLKYEGSAISTIGGLSHLEGKEVVVLASGGVIEGKVVTDGQISLDSAHSSIVVGLPYEFSLETLNIEGENTFGLKKIISEVSIKVDKSREDFFIVSKNGEEIQNPRSIESINDADFLFCGSILAYPLEDYDDEVSVKILQKYPLALTITSLSATLTVESDETNEA